MIYYVEPIKQPMTNWQESTRDLVELHAIVDVYKPNFTQQLVSVHTRFRRLFIAGTWASDFIALNDLFQIFSPTRVVTALAYGYHTRTVSAMFGNKTNSKTV
jgi:hypothetical protein